MLSEQLFAVAAAAGHVHSSQPRPGDVQRSLRETHSLRTGCCAQSRPHLLHPRNPDDMMGLNLHMRAPVASRCPHAVPRSVPTASAVQPTAAFRQSTAALRIQSCGRRAQRRGHLRLDVRAAVAKKSVGDLSKAELEGKVVFVRPCALLIWLWFPEPMPVPMRAGWVLHRCGLT